MSVLSQRVLIFGAEVSLFEVGDCSPLGTGMLGLTVTPTFTLEADLPPSSGVMAWKVLMTFLNSDSQGSRCWPKVVVGISPVLRIFSMSSSQVWRELYLTRVMNSPSSDDGGKSSKRCVWAKPSNQCDTAKVLFLEVVT